jgi:hypothetical protein
MTARVDNTPGAALTTTIAGLRSDIDALKTRQKARTTVFKTYLNQNAGSSDRTFTLAAYAAPAVFTVTFTSAIEKYAIANLIMQIFSPAEIHPDIATVAFPNLLIVQRPVASASPMTTIWDITFTNYDLAAHTYLVKFYVQSTDNGGVTNT